MIVSGGKTITQANDIGIALRIMRDVRPAGLVNAPDDPAGSHVWNSKIPHAALSFCACAM